MSDNKPNIHAITTWQYTTESYPEFLTRIASIIQSIEYKIVHFDIDMRSICVPLATIIYTDERIKSE